MTTRRRAGRLAKLEVAGVVASADAVSDRLGLAESALAGIVLSERVLIALRRMAQEDASARLNAEPPDLESPPER